MSIGSFEGGGGKRHNAKVGFTAWTCKRERMAQSSISEFAQPASFRFDSPDCAV